MAEQEKYEDWKKDKEVTYELIARVDDEIVFSRSYSDVDTVCAASQKAEDAFKKQLEEDFEMDKWLHEDVDEL